MYQVFTSRILYILCLCFWSALCLAQRPLAGETLGKVVPASAYPKSATDNDAGAVAGFSDFVMQSNSFGEGIDNSDTRTFSQLPDTVFLCFNDQFTIDHQAGSEDLSGDPDPSTAAAVGFGFYTCAPTVTGDNIMAVRDDPCVADEGVEPAGNPLFDSLVLSIGQAYASGDYDVVVINDEAGGLTFPELYNGNGDTGPITFVLAPVTADGVNPTNLNTFWEQIPGDTDTPAGSCVNVSTDFAVTVAFLNPLVASAEANFATCAGNARIEGGAPELRGNNGYTVIVENTTTSERARLTTPLNTIGHDETVTWEVTTPGEYRLIVTDDVSCESFVQTFTHAEGCMDADLRLTLPTATALPGMATCLPVTAENFYRHRRL